MLKKEKWQSSWQFVTVMIGYSMTSYSFSAFIRTGKENRNYLLQHTLCSAQKLNIISRTKLRATYAGLPFLRDAHNVHANCTRSIYNDGYVQPEVLYPSIQRIALFLHG